MKVLIQDRLHDRHTHIVYMFQFLKCLCNNFEKRCSMHLKRSSNI